MDAHEISKLQSKVRPYAKLDYSVGIGEYTNWLVEIGNRWDMTSPPMLKAYIAELKRVLKNYKQNYVIEEVEEQAMPRTYKTLRFKGDDW